MTTRVRRPEPLDTPENTETQWRVISRIFRKEGIRSLLMWTPPVVEGLASEPINRRLVEVAVLARYGCDHPSTRKREPMDVKAMVTMWHDSVIAYCTAHTKEEFERADYKMDDLFGPILAAPVRQLREFYPALTESLKTDKRVPLYIWSTFEKWSTDVLSKSKDEDVIELKTGLAREIAAMVESDIKPDIMEAVANALKWRPAEKLEKVKAALKAGKKPKLTGRDSCLFLEVDGEQVML